ATDNSDAVASFSDRASFMSLYAPGVAINSSVPPNSYLPYYGTSMAAPHVAGAWAILKQRMPSATVSQILSMLQSTGVPITDSGFTIPRLKIDSALNLSTKADTVGLYNPANAAFLLRDSNTNGIADMAFPYGPAPNTPAFTPLVGKWIAGSYDSIGLYNPS